jgi:hypothetical protein
MRALAFPALFVAVAACSSQPTTPQAEPAPVATARAPGVPESATVSPATEPAPAPTEGVADAKPTGKVPSGYRRETRNGRELYCRNVTTLGSRFPQKTCFTREQLQEIQDRTESAMDDLEQGMKVCGGGEACGNGT